MRVVWFVFVAYKIAYTTLYNKSYFSKNNLDLWSGEQFKIGPFFLKHPVFHVRYPLKHKSISCKDFQPSQKMFQEFNNKMCHGNADSETADDNSADLGENFECRLKIDIEKTIINYYHTK